jgi:hypothetical protein
VTVNSRDKFGEITPEMCGMRGKALRGVDRPGVMERVLAARHVEPLLGFVSSHGRAVGSSQLPDLATAAAITAEARLRAEARPMAGVKGGPLCGSHSLTCSGEAEPVFRAVRLDIQPDEELVSVDVEVLDGGIPIDELDGHEVLSMVGLTLEATATVRDGGGIERDVPITDPLRVSVFGDQGGGIRQLGRSCDQLEVAPGAFDYLVGINSAHQFQYYDEFGEPCCWMPTEVVHASIVAEMEVDDGQGGASRVFREAETVVKSIPRPADPCEVRTLESGIPSFAAYPFVEVGTAYLTDACGNIVYGVGLADSEDHNQPGDEFRVVAPVGPVWATARSDGNHWSYSVLLNGDVGEPGTIPDGSYTVDFEVASQSPECSAGGVITGSYTVSIADDAPQVVLWWDWEWDAQNSPRGPEPDDQLLSPGSALRDRSGTVAMWRVPAFDGAADSPFFAGSYSNVPVKLYVAWYGSITFDPDGSPEPSYLEPVEGVELCTGVVEKLTDAGGHLGYDSPVRTTCDTPWTTFATAGASSDPVDTPENPAGPPDTWVPVGLGIGVTKGPEQPGRYVLVAEPIDPAFRRGDAWRVMSPFLPDGFVEFDVGGGMFLDEDFNPTDRIDVAGETAIYLKAVLASTEDLETVTLEVSADGTTSEQHSVTLARVGSLEGSVLGVYMGEVVVADGPPAKSRGTKELTLPSTQIISSGPFSGFATGYDDTMSAIALALLTVYRIEVVDVRGLYKPIDGRYDRAGGSYIDHYKSEDNAGRIYANWVYDHTDPGLGRFPTEADDQQFVDLEVLITPPGRLIDSVFGVQWAFTDPDDPTSELMSVRSGCIVDPDDCLGGTSYVEAKPNDNSGQHTDVHWELPRLPDGSADSTFPIVDYFWDEGEPAAVTMAADDRSSIRFEPPNPGGDNYTVRARLVPLSATRSPIGPTDETGMMTVWRKIYLEDRWMLGEQRLPVEEIQSLLEFTFIEVHSPDEIPESSGEATFFTYLEPDPPWPGIGNFHDVWTGGGSIGQFHHRAEPEWHFACAAVYYSDATDCEPKPPDWVAEYEGVMTIVDNVRLQTPTATFVPGELVGRPIVIRRNQPNEYTFVIDANSEDVITITPEQQERYWDPFLAFPKFSGGFGLLFPPLAYPGTVSYQIPPEGAGYEVTFGSTTGPASSVFVGAHENYYDEGWQLQVVRTLVHELEHHFVHLSLPILDMCGNPSVEADPGLEETEGCVMNYDNYPVLFYDGRFERTDPGGSRPCAAHVRALRHAVQIGRER